MILNVLFIAAYVAVICSALLVALLAVKALRYLIIWYDDRYYAKRAAEKYQEFERYQGRQLYAEFKEHYDERDN